MKKDSFSTDNRINKEMNNLMNYLPDSAESVKNFRSLNSKTSPLIGDLNEDNNAEMSRKVYDWSKQPYAYVILADNGKKQNMLQERNLKIAHEIVKLVTKIQTAEEDEYSLIVKGLIPYNNKNLTWSDLCQKNFHESDQCLEHPFMTLIRQSPLPMVQLSLLMKYPEIRIQNVSIDTTILFGKVKQNAYTGLVESVAALRLPFLLQNEPNNLAFSNLIRKWQRKFVDQISKLKHSTLVIDFSTSISLNDEIARNGKLLIDYLPAVFFALVVFSCFCCFHIDWVLSQPLLGFCGVLTAAQAVVVAFGILISAGFSFIQMVYIMPFFVLAVSADNAFLVLNAWRNTHPLAETKHRLAKAVGSTSVSIMITALTDGLSFAVGTISQFPAIRIFCTYCALAILCSFLFQMTFFVSCLVLCAQRESSNRHCLCLWRVHPRVESDLNQEPKWRVPSLVFGELGRSENRD
uniref:SSD domain-containing protein n=1 Tax=Romanomermis culicivorax TaxID=13658 RepID=A0A915JMD5_ROMCU